MAQMPDDERLIFEGTSFEVGSETWVARVENQPGASAANTDRLQFELALQSLKSGEVRRLTLIGSRAGIHVENHTLVLFDIVRAWLQSGETVGAVEYFGERRGTV